MRRLLLLLALLGLVATLAAGCGSGDEEASTVTVTTTETVTETVTTTEEAAGGGECSAAGLSADVPQDPALPQSVADVRERIVQAAVECDYDRLQEVALEGDGGFTFSYGAETSAADHWARAEERGEDVMRILVETLKQEGHQYQGNWVWPTAYADSPTDADWEALEGLYPQDQLDAMRQAGQFLGYRVGITPAGDWMFFVAGD